jgi:hypothetical protein
MAGSFRGEFAGGFNVQVDTRQVKWERITKAVATKQRKVLFGTGAFGAKAVNRMIRKQGKKGGRAHVSKPNTPPKYHIKPGLKDRFYFNVNLDDATVQVGPGVQKRSSNRITVHAKSGAELLEFGGHFTVNKTKKRAFVEPRPFLRPALEKKITPVFYRNIERIPLK